MESPSQTAKALTDFGIQLAVDHADHESPEWSEWAYKIMLWFIDSNDKPFMVEDVRQAAKDVLPAPPSERAWGAIVRRAKKEGKIKMVDYSQVKNERAHCTPASLWIKA